MIDIRIGDCREVLKELPDKSVHCCVTSPPYFGLRDYGVKGQIGLEQKLEEYVYELVRVFREVKRVLRDDGTLWLNMGDTYGGGSGGNKTNRSEQKSNYGTQIELRRGNLPKQLLGVPWRAAFALQADGWYLRQDIIWSKGNPMPESVTDRCTKSHEYIFLLSKSRKYFYDSEAIAEPTVSSDNHVRDRDTTKLNNVPGRQRMAGLKTNNYTMKNKRSVWNVNSSPYKGAHFATFPPGLIEPCVLAGTSEYGACSECGAPYHRYVERKFVPQNDVKDPNKLRKGSKKGLDSSNGWGETPRGCNMTKTINWFPPCDCQAEIVPALVLDPFAGSGTVGQVCNQLGRNAILIELNPEYEKLILDRCKT